MTQQDWSQIRFFNPQENWGSADKMNINLLWLLDSFREHIGIPIYVVCGTQGIHVKDSMHYVGKACDLVIDCNKTSPMDILLQVFKFPFTAVGVMPLARYSKYEKPFGLHLDVRDVRSLPRGMTTVSWIAIPDKSKKSGNQYLALNDENLRKYGII